MKYDFYNQKGMYKPGLTLRARDRLHRNLFQGLDIRGVFEVGIGFCELADYCRRHNISWTGMDSSPQLLEQARKSGFTVCKGNAPILPEIEEPFNTVFSAHLIEHLENYKEALKFLENCKKRIKEKHGRYLILLFPDIEKIGNFFWQDYTHAFVTTKKRIEDMLFDSGFKLVTSGRYTACFFAASGLISFVGKVFPYFLLPPKVAMFARLSFQQHSYAVAEI